MTPDEKQAYARQFPVHVGVDTAKQFHVLVAQGPDGRRSKPFKVIVCRAGFAATHAHLQDLFPGLTPAQMLVGLEFAGHHGFTFARFLADRGYPVVNVLPAHTNRSKELEDNSPLKTDAKDAAQIAKLVGMGIFVRFPFLTTPYVELRLLSVQRHRLTVEATRFRNRLQGVLDLAWPEFLGQFSGLHKRTPLAILARWPLPQEFVAATPQAVWRHIHAASRGHVSKERVATLIASAKETIALTQATPERRLEITKLLARWALVREQLAVVEARIVALVDQCPEARVLLSVPEISAACAATIVAELGTPADFQHPRQVLKLAGMNLTGRQSGQTEGRRRQSKRGRPMLRRQLFLLAGRWCQPRGLYRPEYEAMRARGIPGTKAVCALARKLVPLLLRIMQTGEPFDEGRWRGNRHQVAA
ncbi:MAG: IS110 family transposase [Gemmatimonadetes bacterium]|nr:IS110 family transposase [Gemmatimonadota bacterium]